MRDPETVERSVRRVEIALQAGFYDLARRVIDELERLSTSSPEPITLSTSLAAIDGLPPRVVGILSRHGIDTVADALARTPDELAALPSIGPESIQQIVSTLRGCYHV